MKTTKQVARQTKSELGRDGHDEDSAETKLVEYLVNTPVEKLGELTDLPLTQINRLAWVSTLNKATYQLAAMIDYCARKQKALGDARKNGGKPKSVKSPERVLLSNVWLEHYLRNRRSIEAGNLIRVQALALKQLELQQERQEMNQFKETA
jgi:hypothetical protein